MGEQGPKPGARTRERGSEAPDPTHSQARPRRPGEGSAVPDADTKVERRASVRPSAFGAPRKSDAPQAREPDAESHSSAEPRASTREVAAALSPHARVLEAARLFDAVSRSRAELRAAANPALLAADPDADGATPVQRLPNQRARGADELVARSARASATNPLESGPQNAAPSAGAPQHYAPRAAQTTRLIRKPWLSLLLFAGMVALSVVPLLRYAVSNEEGAPPANATAPLRRAGLAAPAKNARLEHERSIRAAQAGPSSSVVDREQTIASALSEGTRALETGDVSAAERMFGQVLELAEDNHRAAYGLSRIRLKQNNLSGAEGWIQLALRKRPRRAAYHALYADVLTRMGRLGEARQELALAQANEDARATGSERTSDHGANPDSDEH